MERSGYAEGEGNSAAAQEETGKGDAVGAPNMYGNNRTPGARRKVRDAAMRFGPHFPVGRSFTFGKNEHAPAPLYYVDMRGKCLFIIMRTRDCRVCTPEFKKESAIYSLSPTRIFIKCTGKRNIKYR